MASVDRLADRGRPAPASSASGLQEPGARLSRTYSLAVAAGVIPLIAVVIILAAVQFTAQRRALLERLEDDVVAHNVLLAGLIKNVQDYLDGLATWALINLERDPPADRGVWPGLDMLRLLPASEPREAGDLGGAVAERLAPHMQLGHRAMPYVRWTYTFGADGGLRSLYPDFGGHAATNAAAAAPEFAALFNQMIAAEASGADRGGWSRPFEDPGGAGWQVVRAVPVRQGERLVGAVGSAVLLDFLTGFLRAFDYDAGRAWLVDADGDVLAGTDGPGATWLRLRTLEELLPVSVGPASTADLLTPSSGFRRLGDAYVLTQAVSSTPWRLVFLAGRSEINALILPRFVPYVVILAGLVVVSILAHQLRQRLIVRPALAMVEFIRGESQDTSPAKPKVPTLWRPWLDAVAEAFAAKRASVERMRTDAERFRQLTEANPLPVCVIDAGIGRIIYGNHVFESLFGLSPGEATGFPSCRLFAAEEGHARLDGALQQSGMVDRLEVMARRSDGTPFPVALTARATVFEGMSVIVLGIMDLSEQKRAEADLARQRDALHQSEKLNALGSMLASVAHELNNPLSVVVGYSSMMRDLAADENARERATRVHAAAERCARVVRTFLAMARHKQEARRPTPASRLIEGALEITAYGLRTSDVQVEVEVEDGLPPIEVDADQLILVLMNLIVNAQHALQSCAPPRRLLLRARQDGDAVWLDVADNGPGIPEAIRSRVFDPFFTTKPQGIGTGIGLSVCRTLVEAHGGTIEAAPRPEGGTTFSICMPAHAGVSSATAAEPADEAGPSRSTILIVEDEPDVAELIADVLAADGYAIRLAGSGRQALAEIEAGGVDLIVSDLHMPDLDGQALFETLNRQRPDLAERMIFITGDVLAADVTGFLADAGLAMLDKPIDPFELRIQARNALRLAKAPAGTTASPATV